MKIKGNIFELEEVNGYSPSMIGVAYTDINQTRVFIPMKVLIRLYEGVKSDIERKGCRWEEFVNALFAE